MERARTPMPRVKPPLGTSELARQGTSHPEPTPGVWGGVFKDQWGPERTGSGPACSPAERLPVAGATCPRGFGSDVQRSVLLS